MFPHMEGLSPTNLKYMRFFAAECPVGRIGQQFADEMPWFHIVALIIKLDTPALREWCARDATAQSWGRETLTPMCVGPRSPARHESMPSLRRTLRCVKWHGIVRDTR